MNFFKTNLKYLHKTFGLTQADIAVQVNKLNTTIGNWESGLSEPGIEDLIKLSRFFDIKLDILLLVNIEKNKLITDDHIIEFAKKGKFKKNPVEYNSSNQPTSEVNEPDDPLLWQVLDELKTLKNNVGKLRVEVKKRMK